MWAKVRDKDTGEFYFYNTETKDKSLQRPEEGYRLYHILIKHSESRSPINLSKEDALQVCKDIQEDLLCHKNESDFRKYFKAQASKHSNCSSAKRGGDLGFVCLNEMLPQFEKVAFKLQRGQFVGPVSTQSGYHIIYRG